MSSSSRATSRGRRSAAPTSRSPAAPRLHAVVAQQPGVGTLFDHWDNRPDFAAYCPLSGLPRLAGTRLEYDPGARSPICGPIPQRTARWAGAAGGARCRPAIAASASPGPAGRPITTTATARSRWPPSRRLTDCRGWRWCRCRRAPGQAQIGNYWGRRRSSISAPRSRDFGDTMAILECLELIVTVDTSVGHLAGAMGKDACGSCCPIAPDWRWLLDRSDSPWYPTAAPLPPAGAGATGTR